MVALDLEEIKEDAWRLNVSTFAERVSRGRWIAFPWLEYLLDVVQDKIAQGGARILINAPPRHGKSESIAHWLPSWFLDWNPRARVILASYSDTYAARWGLAVRDEFAEDKPTWTRIRPDKSLVSDWQTKDGGGMRSVGVGGSVTGHGADLLVIDDPHKDWEEAMSLTARSRVHDWVEGTIAPRLEPGGSIVLIQTRWHEDDETGRLAAKEDEHWDLLKFPALSEGEGDLLGRGVDVPLCPERYPFEVLDEIRRARGSYRWAGLYQQRPAPIRGGIIRRDWFGYWQPGDGIPSDARWIISIDPTQKQSGTSFFVAQVWAAASGKYFLVDQFRSRVSFLESIHAILKLRQKWPQVEEVVVEESANGPALIDALKSSVPGLQSRPAKSSKEARLLAISGIAESGSIFLPASVDWLDAFIQEVILFPNAANDDQVDSMTMAITWLSTKTAATFDFVIPSSGSRSNLWKEING